MTDRSCAYIAILEKDVRDDDLGIADAIARIKGVLEVRTVGSDYTQQVAYSRARSDLYTRLLDVLDDKTAR